MLLRTWDGDDRRLKQAVDQPQGEGGGPGDGDPLAPALLEILQSPGALGGVA